MKTIEIDFDVYKELTIRRTTEDVTYNDVLRDLLGLGQAPKAEDNKTSINNELPWVIKGVTFESGTEMRANYKGKIYYGNVENGALVVNGKRYSSPSAAAMSITDNSVNGWIFWQYKIPGRNVWKKISTLKK